MSTWMVVEDEPSIYEILLTMFEMWGIEGVAFVDGEEAFKWIDDVDAGRYKGEVPELALIDIRLPGRISGPMVGERLRQSQPLSNCCIVLTTAYRLSADDERTVRAQAHADDLLHKPLPKFAELKRRLESDLTAKREQIARVQAEAEAEAAAAAQPEAPAQAPDTLPEEPPAAPQDQVLLEPASPDDDEETTTAHVETGTAEDTAPTATVSPPDP